ncbi:MAG: hypothetical protein WBD01_05640 [Salaquimonas sp.]
MKTARAKGVNWAIKAKVLISKKSLKRKTPGSIISDYPVQDLILGFG